MNMKFNVITIFPKIISDYCDETVLARAQKEKIIQVNPVNLRDFTSDKHHTVDDTTYGGGAGMVMKPEPIYKALESLDALRADTISLDHHTTESLSGEVIRWSGDQVKRTVLLSPRGRQFDQALAQEWAKLETLTLVCGRYEGVDQRVIDHMVHEEISIGPYVLAGGELGALVMIEAIARLIPGVLGNPESLDEETFTTVSPNHSTTLPLGKGKKVGKKISDQVIKWSSGQVFEYPQYTKPADFMGWSVPEVLLSGDHKKIAEWRQSQQHVVVPARKQRRSK